MKNLTLLDGFERENIDFVFTGENEKGVLFYVFICIVDVCEYLKIKPHQTLDPDGSDDIMEAARQMYEGWSEREATYSIEVKRQEKLIFKRSAAKAN